MTNVVSRALVLSQLSTFCIYWLLTASRDESKMIKQNFNTNEYQNYSTAKLCLLLEMHPKAVSYDDPNQ